jgi:hypothetical protein
LNCGEYIVLREPLLAIDAVVDGDVVTLHAKVGQILRISLIGESRRIFLSLLFYASEFPSSRIPAEGAAPPNRRQYVEYPQHVVFCNIVKWFPSSSIRSEASMSSQGRTSTKVEVPTLWEWQTPSTYATSGRKTAQFSGQLVQRPYSRFRITTAICAATGTFWFESLR